MFSWKRSPNHPASDPFDSLNQTMKERARLWDLAYVAGGVLLAGLTLKAYRGFDAPSNQLSQNRMSARDAEGVIASAKAYLNSNPDDFDAWSQLGMAYFYKGPEFYPDALNAIDKARQLGSTSESLYYYAGVMFESLRLPDYAYNELSKYLRHHPEDYETQVRLANLLVQLKKYEDAYKLYQALVRGGSKDPTLWYNMALVSKEKGDLDGALAAFKQLNALTKLRPEGGLLQEGEVWRLKGSDDQAMGFYQQEISLHPSFLPAYVSLEAAQRRHSLWKEARETHQKISGIKAAQPPPLIPNK